jgi:AcrR family transcriptional regulator
MRDEQHADSHHHHYHHHHHHHEDIVELVITRRERHHRETRDEILVAAREVLLERGAADLSLREIARRACFSPGALYKYFDSKDDLVKALADNAMGSLLREFARVPVELAPDERALEMGMVYLEFARRNPEDVAVIAQHEAMVHALPLSPEHRQFEEIVTGVFKEGIARGVFTAANEQEADYMAYGAWALVQGLATFEQNQRPELSQLLRARQRQLMQVFINGLKSDWSAPEPGSPVT